MLRDVSKRGPLNDLDDRLGMDTECAADSERQFAYGGALSNLTHSVRRQLCASVATFAGHVGEIISACAKKQMPRVATTPVVARVADHQAGWYWAVCQLVRKAMRGHLYASAFDGAVSDAAAPFRPWPALIWIALLDAFPEANYRIDSRRGHSAILPCEAV